MIYIRNGKRFNIYSRGEVDGVRYPNFTSPATQAALGITAVEEPLPPADYSKDTYDRVEQDDAPYVVYVQKSSEQIAEIRWTRLKQIRDELTDNGGCLVQGKWFHTDAKSKQQQMALVMLGENVPSTLLWKTMDGSFAPMSAALAAELFAAQVARETHIFALAELKQTDGSVLTEGWPERYVAPEQV